MPETLTNCDQTSNNDLQRKKRQTLFQLLVLALVLPFFEVFFARWWHDEKSWYIINTVVLMFPTMHWCFLDANELSLRDRKSVV